MDKSLPDRVGSFRNNLELLAISPGFMDVGDRDDARTFYEQWAELNRECISAGHEDGAGDLSFVAESLDRLLRNFPPDQTTIGVLEVFPFCGASAIIFGLYITTLYRIARTKSVPA